MFKKLLLLFAMAFALCVNYLNATVYLVSEIGDNGTKIQNGTLQHSRIKKGKVTYNASEKVLTLDNAEIQGGFLIKGGDNITINLVGKNLINATDLSISAIVSDGASLTVSSSSAGSLKVLNSGSYTAIRIYDRESHSVTIKDCYVDFQIENGFALFAKTQYNPAIDLTIDNASFTAVCTGDYSAFARVKSLNLKDCEVVSPSNYSFNETGALYYKNERGEKLECSEFHVRPKQYGITVCGIEVDALNRRDILGDGSVRYIINEEYNAEYLELNSCSIDYSEGNIIEFTKPGNYKLTCIGYNVLSGGDMDMNPVSGIYSVDGANVKITGGIYGRSTLDINTYDICICDGTLEISNIPNVTTNGMHVDGTLIVDGGTFCIEDPTCVYGDFDLVMYLSGIQNEGVTFDSTEHQFVDVNGNRYTDGPIIIDDNYWSYDVNLMECYTGTMTAVVDVLAKKLGIGLQDANNLAGAVPCTVLAHAKKRDADALYKALYEAGAHVVNERYYANKNSMGTAKRTDGIDVKWVQLWEDGPKFAEYNVGTTYVTSFGGYYCWGKSTDQDDFQIYNEESIDDLAGQDDTATKLWGRKWRMPTRDELEALLEECDAEWTDDYKYSGTAGTIFTGKGNYSKNSLFIPAAGVYYGYQVTNPGKFCCIWSSTPYSSGEAFYLSATQDTQFVTGTHRSGSISVRAVLAENGICVILENCGASKLQVVKALKEALGIGLKEAKNLADSTPCIVLENATEAEANALAAALRAVGATVSVKIPGKKEDTTSIAETTANTGTQQSALYDLQGRKVSKLQRGLNIMGGKKVLR